MVRRVPLKVQVERPCRAPQEKAILNAHIREAEAFFTKRQGAIDTRAAELSAQVNCGALTKEEASQLFDEWMTKRGVALLQRRDHVARRFGQTNSG